MHDAPHPGSNDAEHSVSLIIPTFGARPFILKTLERLAQYAETTPALKEVILIDDGSRDGTSETINQFLATHPGPCLKFTSLDQNVGKGSAIKKGIHLASGDIIIFTDCDLPYTFSNIDAFTTILRDGHADVAIGSRMHPESIYHIRSNSLAYIHTRHTLGRIFNFFINCLTRLNIADTQAGLKGFTREAANLCFGKMTVSGFAFDIDLLVCAKQNMCRIEILPLTFTGDSEVSTVHFLKHTILMPANILQIVFKN
jgi:glycosyltransferase involved in cell wall biosynthesis